MSTESTPSASHLVSPLMDQLRHELAQYGEMLALLDQQQEHVLNRSADQVVHSVQAINVQMEVLRQARSQRESTQNEVAQALEKPEVSSFVSLIPELPEKYQGALSMLVRETNALLERVQKKARQNHLLLARSLELMQQFLTSLSPAPAPTTYNETGRLASTSPSPKQLYEAIG